jgi:ElaB/YqjD/DUF883 family membrane-anchored ribosome-binding protein
MQPDRSAVSDSDRGTAPLDDLLMPVRDSLEEAARNLGEGLTKAREAANKLREIDIAEVMRRSPLAALSVAAGIGILAGLCLWARRR